MTLLVMSTTPSTISHTIPLSLCKQIEQSLVSQKGNRHKLTMKFYGMVDDEGDDQNQTTNYNLNQT